jgi:hypothetical protein
MERVRNDCERTSVVIALRQMSALAKYNVKSQGKVLVWGISGVMSIVLILIG